MDDRLRAVCDLMVPTVREMAGLHEYDGRMQDLSPEGVRSGLSAMERARREAAGETRVPPRPTLPVETEGWSLEEEPHREEPELVNLDERGAAASRRRRLAAEARNPAGAEVESLTERDEIADVIAASERGAVPERRFSRDELRRAILWREILGRPVGLRD